MRLVGRLLPWLVLMAALIVSVGPLLLSAPSERMTDLTVYLGAGNAALARADVYDFRTALGAPFVYPPFAAVLTVPFALLPVGFVQWAWVVATVAAVVAVCRTALRSVVERIGVPATVALVLLSAPMRSHLRFGQVGIFLVLLVVVDAQRRSGRGVATGIAAAVKLTPAVFLPWLVLTDRRAFWRAVAVAGVCTAGGMLLLWPSAVSYVTEALWDGDRFGPKDWAGNQSVRGMLLRSGLPEGVATPLWAVLSLVILVVATLGARRLDRRGERFAAVATLAAASVAISPISWVHHLIWLALPIAALVAAQHCRLAAAWYAVLTVSAPSLGSAGLRSDWGPAALWHLIIDAQGMTAVVAAVALPWLLTARSGPDATAHLARVTTTP